MTEPPRAGVLLVDDDELLLNGLARLLRSTRRRVLTATTAELAGELLSNNNVGVIVCEPRDPRLAAFLIAARQHHPAVVRVILTGYATVSCVTHAFNEAHPFKLLSKPWGDEELLATIRLAFEQHSVNRKRDQLIEEYAGIRSNAERAHAFHVLGALLYSAHTQMGSEAINDLPVGALVLKGDALAQLNPMASSLLSARGLALPVAGSAVADLPTALSALVKAAQGAPRRQRMSLRLPTLGKLDYFVQDLDLGLLIAFAPAPQAQQPAD